MGFIQFGNVASGGASERVRPNILVAKKTAHYSFIELLLNIYYVISTVSVLSRRQMKEGYRLWLVQLCSR